MATTSRSLPNGAKRKDESRIPRMSSPGPPSFQKTAKSTELTCFMAAHHSRRYTFCAKERWVARSGRNHTSGRAGIYPAWSHRMVWGTELRKVEWLHSGESKVSALRVYGTAGDNRNRLTP